MDSKTKESLTTQEISSAIHAINVYMDTPKHTQDLEDFNKWLRGLV